jgi:hypothetical protein
MIRSDSVFTCGASNGKTQECQEQRVEEHSRSVLNIQEANESKTHGKEREREREREREGGGARKQVVQEALERRSCIYLRLDQKFRE